MTLLEAFEATADCDSQDEFETASDVFWVTLCQTLGEVDI